MAKFVQIGDLAIAEDHITYIFFAKDIYVHFDTLDGHEQAYRVFYDEERDLFMHWWENEADVHKVTIPHPLSDDEHRPF